MNKAKKLLSMMLAVVLTASVFSFTAAPESVTSASAEPASGNVTYIDASQLVAGNWWDKGGSVTLPQAQANAAVIQAALDTAGQNGGGTVVMPEGRYCVAPQNLTETEQACIYLRYDNLTLTGAGKDGDTYKTVLSVNAHWNGDGNHYDSRSDTAFGTKYLRSMGIQIVGDKSNNATKFRKNVRIEGFELDGGRGWTGNYTWGYDTVTDYGWDVYHKGIIVSWSGQKQNFIPDRVTHIYLNDLYVHSFSGETLYVGGDAVGYLEVTNCTITDTNASCFNLYASMLNVQNNRFGDPYQRCRFWIEYCPRPSSTVKKQNIPELPSYFNYGDNTAYFSGNEFYNTAGGHGIAIAQGDSKTYTMIFENNTFDNYLISSNRSAFQVAGAIYGPIYIRNNTFSHIAGSVLTFSYGGDGTVDENGNYNVGWRKNKNIYLQDNVGTDLGSPIVDMLNNWGPGTQYLENIFITGNNFTAKQKSNLSIAVGNYGNTTQLTNVKVTNNTFQNCTEPKEVRDFAGDVPLFADNTYINTTVSVQAVDSSNNQLKPFYETLFVSASSATTVTMRTGRYTNGQRVVISGYSGTGPITLTANSPSHGYDLPETYVLNSGDELELQYDAAAGVWKLAADATYGDATGDDQINASDLSRLKQYMANYDYATGTSTAIVSAGADATGDGKINASDLSRLKQYMANYDYSTGSSTVVLGPAG